MEQNGEIEQLEGSLMVPGAPSYSSEGSTDDLISSCSDEDIRNFVMWFLKFVARAYHTARVLRRRRLRSSFERSRRRCRRSFDDGVTESEFRSAYRMSPATFEKLVKILQPHLSERLHENNTNG